MTYRLYSTRPIVLALSLAIVSVGSLCTSAQVPADLQPFCSAVDRHQLELDQMYKELDRLGQPAPRENFSEAEDRTAKFRALEKRIADNKADFRSRSFSLLPGGTVSNWSGTLKTFGYGLAARASSGVYIDVSIEAECAGGPDGKILVSLRAMDDTKTYTPANLSLGGFPKDSPLLSSMRALHEGDPIRFSGRLVRPGPARVGTQLSAAGTLDFDDMATSRTRTSGLHGFIVLSRIESAGSTAIAPPAARDIIDLPVILTVQSVDAADSATFRPGTLYRAKVVSEVYYDNLAPVGRRSLPPASAIMLRQGTIFYYDLVNIGRYQKGGEVEWMPRLVAMELDGKRIPVSSSDGNIDPGHCGIL